MENQLKKKIAIQGGVGSFHEIASIFHFGYENIETVPFETFQGLVSAVESNKVDSGLMAIENTVAGSLMPNYVLLEERDIFVVGEILLHIEQNLLAIHGQKVEEIKEVHSHPIALMQCSRFFDNHHHIKLIETDDTANSARKIKDENLMGIGAIASQRAAGLFGLNVLEAGIETNKRNFTRFLVITNKNHSNGNLLDPNTNKASISFSLAHKTGSLSKVLSIFSFYNINLSKIQSIPIIGKEWEYHFIVDLVYDDYDIYRQSLVAIKPLIDKLQVLGEYKKAEAYYHSNEILSDENGNVYFANQLANS
ncbi:MAG: prephenate dehydratase [Bacteroidales bacterium]